MVIHDDKSHRYIVIDWRGSTAKPVPVKYIMFNRPKDAIMNLEAYSDMAGVFGWHDAGTVTQYGTLVVLREDWAKVKPEVNEFGLVIP